MATLGPNDLKQVSLPTYWDASKLVQLALASGESYDQLLAEVNTVLEVVNANLLADPLISSLAYLTEEAQVEYGIGASSGYKPHTEYGRGDEQHGAVGGHMLPVKMYDNPLGFTQDWLRKARRSQFVREIQRIATDTVNIFQKTALEVAFKSTYTAVGSGRSMPWADGGTADSDYVPMSVPGRGGDFAYTHNHIVPLSGITQANVETVAANLYEHGYDAPFNIEASFADRSSWNNTTNLTGFLANVIEGIRYGSTSDIVALDPTFIGTITTAVGRVDVRLNGRIPTGYWMMYKSFGNYDIRNPMAIRYQTDFGFGAKLKGGDSLLNPMLKALVEFEFGFGVSDRVGAVVVCNHADTYTDPTIT